MAQKSADTGLLTGTFLLCFGLLAFEIFCARLLTVVVGPYLVLLVIALAMLGMSSAASIMSLSKWPRDRKSGYRVISWLCFALGFLYLFLPFVLTLSNESYNREISSALEDGGLEALVDFTSASYSGKVAWVGFLLSIPYFIFGFIIVAVFRVVDAGNFHRVYFSDLLGASLGALVSIVVMEWLGFVGALTLVPLVTFAAAIAFRSQYSSGISVLPATGLVVTLVIAITPALNSKFEPQPDINQLARNYEKINEVDQTWHTWNSHSRVARLSLAEIEGSPARDIYAQGDGTGWANVPYWDPDRAPSIFQSTLTTALKPTRVLVLFAGVGFDMLAIDQLCDQNCEITGVEINRQMTNHAIANDNRLRNFFNKRNIKLINAEAREFLERDTQKYDAILLAWSGAGYSYYVGSSGALAQYLYTQEAFESLLNHLTESGVLVISDGSKARSLLMLREIFESRGLDSFHNSSIIVKKIGSETNINTSFQLDILDRNRLIVKPAGFSAEDIEMITASIANSDHKVVYSPEYVHADYAMYRDLVESDDITTTIESLRVNRNIELSTVTDDRPYFLNLTPKSNYTSLKKLNSADSSNSSPEFQLTSKLIIMFLFLAALAVILIVGPLLLSDGPAATVRNFNHLMFFLCLGIGFMLVEVGFVQKFGLLLGNPSHAIAVVLAAIIFSAGCGAYYSDILFRKEIATFRRLIVVLVLYVGLMLTVLEFVTPAIFRWELEFKILMIIGVMFPMGFFMGQFFPQGLKIVQQQDVKLVPWAWALNGAASTIAVGLGFVLSYPFGFRFVIFCGISCYLIILLLPEYRKLSSNLFQTDPL